MNQKHISDLFNAAEMAESTDEESNVYATIVSYIASFEGVEHFDSTSYVPLGIALRRLGSRSMEDAVTHLTEAISIFRKAFSKDPSDAIAFYELSSALLQSKNYCEADLLISSTSIDLMNSLNQHWRRGKLYEIWACAKCGLGQFPAALDLFLRMKREYELLDIVELPLMYEMAHHLNVGIVTKDTYHSYSQLRELFIEFCLHVGQDDILLPIQNHPLVLD